MNSTAITAITPTGTAGAQNVVVTTSSGSSTPFGGYTYIVLNFVYYRTYPSFADTYWKSTYNLSVTLPSGTGAGQSYGGATYQFDTYTYSDAACTTLLEAKAKIMSIITLTLHYPSYEWYGTVDRQYRMRYNAALASIGGEATNWLYYRNHTPASFGAPWVLGESWTYTEQIDSDQSAGDKTTDGITAAVAAATESVTVPAGTFTCYKVTITQGGKTILQYWDASGLFPYVPIKIVDTVNFDGTDTKTLQSTNLFP